MIPPGPGPSRSRRFFARLAGEAVLVLAIGATAGFARNALRTDPLPYRLSPSLLTIESGARAVFPKEALRLHDRAEHIFVDARSRDAFVNGHIAGALSLPVAQFDELIESLDLWAGGQPLLVYGGRAEPLSADELARRLIESGHAEVLLLAQSFEEWKRAGAPVETGSEGSLDEDESQADDEESDEMEDDMNDVMDDDGGERASERSLDGEEAR
ncbi:MAG: rhodanese-like domain-containing protein [Candidatus Eisenbacteria bacterium]|nr:rhodanese-like domain-containing protein [Candidatus Eisenbacteria bacterium]